MNTSCHADDHSQTKAKHKWKGEVRMASHNKGLYLEAPFLIKPLREGPGTATHAILDLDNIGQSFTQVSFNLTNQCSPSVCRVRMLRCAHSLPPAHCSQYAEILIYSSYSLMCWCMKRALGINTGTVHMVLFCNIT